MKLCDYGCGNEGVYQLKNGKYCCCQNCNSCSEKRRKNSSTSKNQTSWIKGLHHSKEIFRNRTNAW